jgi:hypothetical protein
MLRINYDTPLCEHLENQLEQGHPATFLATFFATFLDPKLVGAAASLDIHPAVLLSHG